MPATTKAGGQRQKLQSGLHVMAETQVPDVSPDVFHGTHEQEPKLDAEPGLQPRQYDIGCAIPRSTLTNESNTCLPPFYS